MSIDTRLTRVTHRWKVLAKAVVLSTGMSIPAHAVVDTDIEPTAAAVFGHGGVGEGAQRPRRQYLRYDNKQL